MDLNRAPRPVTAIGSTPTNAAHPHVIAARHTLTGKLAAEITDSHDITDPATAEQAVRGYIVEPRNDDRIALYWLEQGRAVRRNGPYGSILDRLADHLTRAGWTVEPMLRTTLCVHARRNDEAAPEAALTEWERDLLAAGMTDTPQRYTTADENAAAEDTVDTEALHAMQLITEAEATDGTWRGEWIGDQPTPIDTHGSTSPL